MIRLLKVTCLCLLSFGLMGCVRGCTSTRPPIHINPNMDDQPRYDPQAESGFFYNGSTMRLPVAGTIARGQLHPDARVFTGLDESGAFLAESPLPVDDALLARGEARFNIYCAPCHTKRGNGKGILTQRGGVPVPSFYEDRIKQLADGEIFDTITNGKGLMKGYRYPIPAEDRWAIIAHVRELQRKAEEAAATLAGN
jgi:mono/diheme cytochrome c family protein